MCYSSVLMIMVLSSGLTVLLRKNSIKFDIGGSSLLWVVPSLGGSSGFYKKEAVQVQGSMPVSNISPWLLITSCFHIPVVFEFLPCLPSIVEYDVEIQAR